MFGLKMLMKIYDRLKNFVSAFGTFWLWFACFSEHLKGQHSTCLGGSSEKAMAPHSNTLASKIPWREEPGRLWSMGSLRVWHTTERLHFHALEKQMAISHSFYGWVVLLYWRRKWQPTPVFLPGESQGRGCLVGCRLWGHTESDTTEAT